jgi:hypothetical protein
MTERDQLGKWVKGENIHNHTRDECCPDFACCQPNNHWPNLLRLKFHEAYLAGGDVMPMLLMALSGVVPDDVHIAGMGVTQ